MSLIKDILNGNKNQFHWIVEEWYDVLFYRIKKIVKDIQIAEDLTNDVFVKVYQNLDTYKEEYKFGNWISKIASNTAIDYLRNKKLRPDLIHQYEDHRQFSDEESKEEIINSIEEYNYVTIKDAIEKLKPIYCKVLKLRYYEELTYEEISNKLKMPIGTIKAYIHRAKKALTKLVYNQKQ